MNDPELAIFNGPKVRSDGMPARHSFADEELAQIKEVFAYYQARSSDIGYQGHFEELYCDGFVKFLGGDGYCDAVNSGTNALYLAVRALGIPEGAHVLVSPVTDPGTLSAIILNRLVPVVVDSLKNSYNIGAQGLAERFSDKVKAILVVHLGGKPAQIEEIVEFARARDLYVIEDCSQSHGARYNGSNVGTFGDIGVFSTMFSKNHSTGGTGGVIFTRSLDIHKKIRAHADRGKDFFSPGFDPKDPNGSLFPALNFNQDEISCAIGIESLKKLPKVNESRVSYLKGLHTRLSTDAKACKLHDIQEEDAPFFWPVEVDLDKIKCRKEDFAAAVKAEGIWVNPHYKFMVTEWGWARKFLHDDFSPVNAVEFQRRSFNLLFNEKFGPRESEDTARAILKVERHYLR